jgi:hypothetical protein
VNLHLYVSNSNLYQLKLEIPDYCHFPKDSPSDVNTKPCVRFFAPSHVMWTTYSGYFREVVQMVFCFAKTQCYSLRYDIERDLLTTLYHNITDNQAKTSRLLEQQYEELDDWNVESNAAFEAIAKKQDASLEMSEKLVTLAKQNKDAVKDLDARLFEAAKVVEEMFAKQEKAKGESLKSLAIRNKVVLDREEGLVEKKIAEHYTSWMEDVVAVTEKLMVVRDGMKKRNETVQKLIKSSQIVEDKCKKAEDALDRQLVRMVDLGPGWSQIIQEDAV